MLYLQHKQSTMKAIKILSVVTLATVISSCATILRKDVDEQVVLSPKPDGALVYVNGQYKGVSPVTMNLDPSKTYDVKYIHPHYISESLTLEKGLIKKWLWLDIASLAVSEKWKGFNSEAANVQMLHWSEIENPNDYLYQIFQLKNLYFETGSANIKQESQVNVDKLADFLKRFPESKIAIHGHTDKTGGRDLNMKLSQDRAKAVATYLETKGIAKSRMTSDGFGPDKPLVEGDSEEALKYNRRVEFEFTK